MCDRGSHNITLNETRAFKRQIQQTQRKTPSCCALASARTPNAIPEDYFNWSHTLCLNVAARRCVDTSE